MFIIMIKFLKLSIFVAQAGREIIMAIFDIYYLLKLGPNFLIQ